MAPLSFNARSREHRTSSAMPSAEESQPPAEGPAGIVLVNDAAGLARLGDDAKQIRNRLESLGDRVEVRRVAPDRLADEIASAVRSGCRVVGVSGGDGSIASAAALLAGTDLILAPFPGGTLNHFARRLGITDREIALEAFGSPERRGVPVGIVDDAVFLNTATFGYYAMVVRHRDRLRRWMPKKVAGLVASFAGWMKLRLYAITVAAEGGVIHRVTPLIWVGVEWAEEDSPGGHLAVMIVTAGTRRQMARLISGSIVGLLRGKGPDKSFLESFQSRNLTITGPRTLSVTLDGEVRKLRTPVYVGMVDDALVVTTGSRGDAPGADSGRERKSVWSRLLWSNWAES